MREKSFIYKMFGLRCARRERVTARVNPDGSPHVVAMREIRRRAIYSTILTVSSAAFVSGASFAVAPSDAVVPLVGILPIVGAVLIGFLAVAFSVTFFATNAPHRSSMPHRVKYLLPAIGMAVTFVTASIAASITAMPELVLLGAIHAIATSVAFVARLIEDERVVLPLLDPTYNEEPDVLFWSDHHRIANEVFLFASGGIVGAGIMRAITTKAAAGAVLALNLLAISAVLRVIATHWRRNYW